MEVFMKKYLVVMVLLLPIVTHAAHVYIWNYDPLDRFYESAIGDSVDCSYWVKQTLTSGGHTYVIGTTLPTDIDPYDAVFVLLGWFRC